VTDFAGIGGALSYAFTDSMMSAEKPTTITRPTLRPHHADKDSGACKVAAAIADAPGWLAQDSVLAELAATHFLPGP
jgi:hypothetical protein